MTYELAKQLKDAGFPQKPRVFLPLDNYGELDERNSITYPSLSDLIGACGDRFDSVGTYRPFGDGWVTFAADPEMEARGTTPEEAVARLWLALHGKD